VDLKMTLLPEGMGQTILTVAWDQTKQQTIIQLKVIPSSIVKSSAVRKTKFLTALPIRQFNLVILTIFDRVHNYLCNVGLFHDDRVLLLRTYW
jgi:hypothetical protein